MVKSGLGAGAIALELVPGSHRRKILSGMRWTVWMAALCLPFSAATTVILGRVGPEVLGTYGLLSVYITFVAGFLFFGGDPVVIRFLPECKRRDRLPFIWTYFVLTLAATTPWILVAYRWPGLIERLLGRNGSAHFDIYVLCLAPVLIAFSMLTASLKAVLEIRWAQTLYRSVTILTCVIYALVYLLARSSFRQHSSIYVWGIYLSLAACAGGAALVHLVRSSGGGARDALRLFLPAGFWRYLLATQQVSMTTFLMNRLDYILILNYASLSVLGRYVVILSIANLIPQINGYFLETLLPSLMNLVISGNQEGAQQVFTVHMRLVFAVDAAVSCALMLFATQITSIIGAEYTSLSFLVILAVLFFGLGSPGLVGGTLLSTVGKQRKAAWIGMFQLGLFIIFFMLLWERYQLLGAVVALGVSSLAASVILMIVGRRAAGRYATLGSLPGALTVVLIATAALAAWAGRLPTLWALAIWPLAMVLFLALGRYSPADCRSLFAHFIPPVLKGAASRAPFRGVEETDSATVMADNLRDRS